MISNFSKVLEEKDRQIALLNQQLSMLQKMGTAPDNKVTSCKYMCVNINPLVGLLTHIYFSVMVNVCWPVK